MIVLLKAHVSSYTRSDGTFVQSHDDRRAAAKEREKSIDELHAEHEAAEPFSEESEAISEKLQARVLHSITEAIKAGDMPVFKVSDHVAVAIHPSAQREGMYQVTRYSKKGVMGDSQYRSLEDALRQEGLWFKKRMSDDAANEFIGGSLAEEGAFNERKSATLKKSVIVFGVATRLHR